MLDLRDLVVVYGSGRHAIRAVDGASMSVPAGGTLGLVGESGCGKSTIARAVVGLVAVAEGEILLDGVDVTETSVRDSVSYRKRVQMVFQDPYTSLNPRMTIGQSIQEALRLGGEVSRSERRAEATRALELVALPSTAMERYPHEFSGGQRQRLAIARALAVRPEVLILDEVTSALDVSVQATILNLLRGLQRELAMSFLFISHDLSVISVMSDRVAVMYVGQVVETATSATIFSSPRHPYTRALLECSPSLHQDRRPPPLSGSPADPRQPPPGCRFHPRCPIGPTRFPERTLCMTEDPQTIRRLDEDLAACHYAPKAQEAERTIEEVG